MVQRLVHRRERSAENFVLALYDANISPQPSKDSVQYGEWKSSEYSLWAAPPFPVQVGAQPVHRRCVQPTNSFSRYMTATNAHIHQQTLSINRVGSKEKALCGNRPPFPLQLAILWYNGGCTARGVQPRTSFSRYLTQTPAHNHLKTPYSTASGNQVNTLCGQRPHSQYRLVHRRCTAGAFSQ